jgi:GTP pyrophosphokinase
MTNTQIRKLGDRLRTAEPSETDLQLLEEFRTSFAVTFEKVAALLTNKLGLTPTGRSKKTTASIIAKLRRLKTRLDRMQDIAGCRIVVPSISDQDSIVSALQREFSETKTDDLRNNPHHGYRAVHVIVRLDNKPIEIQVRTTLQHQWAELCERLADRGGIEIKYGGGPKPLQDLLMDLSAIAATVETGQATGSLDAEKTLKRLIQSMERATRRLEST